MLCIVTKEIIILRFLKKFIKFLDDNNKFLKKIYITHRDKLSLIKDIKNKNL